MSNNVINISPNTNSSFALPYDAVIYTQSESGKIIRYEHACRKWCLLAPEKQMAAKYLISKRRVHPIDAALQVDGNFVRSFFGSKLDFATFLIANLTETEVWFQDEKLYDHTIFDLDGYTPASSPADLLKELDNDERLVEFEGHVITFTNSVDSWPGVVDTLI